VATGTDRGSAMIRGLVWRGARRSGLLLTTIAITMAVAVPGSRAAVQALGPGEVRVEKIPGTEIEFSMAFMPAATVRVGSSIEESGRDEDEGPQRQVQLAPFWMGVHEVTHDEYEIFRFRGLDDHVAGSSDFEFDADGVSRPTPPYEDPAHGLGREGHPAVGMTRRAALYYARWLSEKTGRLYRLPTEAEWEYACRAGAEAPFGFGADSAAAGDYGWVSGNSDGIHHPVGSLQPNAWGLADMHGNVAEWVLDTYAADAYAGLPEDTAALGPVAGDPPRGRGLVRGGGYDDPPVRCADRLPELAAWKRRDPQIPKSPWWNTDSPHVGFRLARPHATLTLPEIHAYWDELLGPS